MLLSMVLQIVSVAAACSRELVMLIVCGRRLAEEGEGNHGEVLQEEGTRAAHRWRSSRVGSG